MAKAETTAGEGILNQTISLAEKLRTERDDALVEVRDMHLRLTRVVEGRQQLRDEQARLSERLDEVLQKDRMKTNEINLLTKEIRQRMKERDAAYTLLARLSSIPQPYHFDAGANTEGPFKAMVDLLQMWLDEHPNPAPPHQ